MLPGRQVHLDLSLTGTEMKVIEVASNLLVQRRQFGIDQQMVVTGILFIGAGARYVHTPQPEVDSGLGQYRRAVVEIDPLMGK